MSEDICYIEGQIEILKEKLLSLESRMCWHERFIRNHYSYNIETIMDYERTVAEINKIKIRLSAYEMAKNLLTKKRNN